MAEVTQINLLCNLLNNFNIEYEIKQDSENNEQIVRIGASVAFLAFMFDVEGNFLYFGLRCNMVFKKLSRMKNETPS